MKVVVLPRLCACLCILAVWLFANSATATPYASGVVNSGGTVSFILNESADNVTVVFDGGASSLNMGALNAGSHNFPLGTATSFEIRVTKSSLPAWTQISTDANLVRFFSARGVAVNMNPTTPLFGRIYVANAVAGTTATGARATGDGIYILNADQTDALGRGDTASTAGFNFTVTPALQNGQTPWRIEVGQDNRLYIADFSTNQGTIYRTDADVTDGSGEIVLQGQGISANPSVHTTICGSPIVTGNLDTGNLTIWAIDGAMPGNFNRLMRWDIGAGPLPYNAAPAQVANPNPLIASTANVTTDNDIGPDGKFFVMQNRFDGNQVGVAVLDISGATIWNSLTESRSISNNPAASDILRLSRAIKVSPDGKTLAIIRDDNQTWAIRLTNGVPDLTRRVLIPTFPATPTAGRDVSFDAAGNLYVVSSGVELLRIFSPGGDSTAVTRSDGTFNVSIVELPEVSVIATDTVASEPGSDTAAFALTRSGDLTGSLTVSYTLTGTASNGIDYATNTLSITFAPGEATTNIVITVTDDVIAEPVETVIFNLAVGATYQQGSPASATVQILDEDLPEIHLSTTDTNTYEPLAGDPVVFLLTRYGDTNADIFSIHLNSTGTATEGLDFTLSANDNDLAMPPGVLTKSVTAFPIDDRDFEGNETIRLEVQGSIDHGPGSPASARLQDNELPPAPVIFADDLDVDTSANWTVLFGANNNIFDATVEWEYDYGSILSIPAAPSGSGLTTKGVRVAVNKNDSTAGGSAGINLYPTGLHFSGDYALRFDMYLQFGTASTTEHTLAGLNHSGAKTNRVTQSADANNTTRGGDGIFVAIETDGSANREYGGYTFTNATALPTLLTNRAASTMASLISTPPYLAANLPAGSPGNVSGTTTPSWANVELSQIAGVITLKVNNNVVWRLPNTSAYTSGNVMIGHNDQFDSVGSPVASVVFDNVQVVDLSLRITSIQILPNNSVQIDFRSPLGGQASDFTLESTPTVSPVAWNPEAGAIITSQGSGFRAVVPSNGDTRFYRIRR